MFLFDCLEFKASDNCQNASKNFSHQLSFSGIFAKSREVTVRFAMPVHQPAWNDSTPVGQIFVKFYIRVFLKQLSRNLMFIGPCIIAIVDE